jgi:hypothetical protein
VNYFFSGQMLMLGGIVCLASREQTLQAERRLAIRAAKLARSRLSVWGSEQKSHGVGISSIEEKRGSFEGAIGISLPASLFFFIDLTFLVIPRNSLKFLVPLFSIPTAPTNLLHLQRLIEAFDTN